MYKLKLWQTRKLNCTKLKYLDVKKNNKQSPNKWIEKSVYSECAGFPNVLTVKKEINQY